MPSDDDEFISREELLEGQLAPGRRANALLFAIENRTAQLVTLSREATELYLTKKAVEDREAAYMDALAAGRDLPVRPTIQDIERNAPHWADLVSNIDPPLRAALAHAFGKKYNFPRESVPWLRMVLGLDEEVVGQAYERFYKQPLSSIYVPRTAWSERAPWFRSGLAAIVAHGKAYAVIQMLEGLIGRERFISFLRALQERYRGRVLSPADFRREAEAAAGSSLDWFFGDWVEGNAVLSYRIESVERTTAGVEVVVRKLGSAGMPLDLELVLDGGRALRRALDREPEVQTLVFEADGKPRQARIDPDRRAALYSPEGAHIWAYRPLLVDVRLLEQAAWGTNVCEVAIRNDDDLPHEVIIHTQTKNLKMPRGWGYQEVRSIPPGSEVLVPKSFIVPPWPGRARLWLTLSDFGGERRLVAKEYSFDFPFVNFATAPLVLTEDLHRVLRTEKTEFPKLRTADRGKFVVYYLMVGEKTAKAAHAGARDAEALARFLRLRLDYYRRQAERKPKKAKFLGGWERRLFLALIAALELDLRAALRGLNAAT